MMMGENKYLERQPGLTLNEALGIPMCFKLTLKGPH